MNLDFSNAAVSEGVPAIEIGEDGANVTELAGKVAKGATDPGVGERAILIDYITEVLAGDLSPAPVLIHSHAHTHL